MIKLVFIELLDWVYFKIGARGDREEAVDDLSKCFNKNKRVLAIDLEDDASWQELSEIIIRTPPAQYSLLKIGLVELRYMPMDDLEKALLNMPAGVPLSLSIGETGKTPDFVEWNELFPMLARLLPNSSLRDLRLQHIDMSKMDEVSMDKFILSCSSLSSLTLHYCGLSSDQIIKLIAKLPPSVKKLNLSYNKFTRSDEVWDTIFRSLARTEVLTITLSSHEVLQSHNRILPSLPYGVRIAVSENNRRGVPFSSMHSMHKDETVDSIKTFKAAESLAIQANTYIKNLVYQKINEASTSPIPYDLVNLINSYGLFQETNNKPDPKDDITDEVMEPIANL